MATLSPPSTAHPQRAPPPSLFLGPPSRNASNLSLSSLAPHLTSGSSTGPTGAPSRLRAGAPSQPDAFSSPASSRGRRQPQPQPYPPLHQNQVQTDGDRTDALWAEMQATLADVEVSAFHSTHVFGPDHSVALEDLRAAQVELAEAWKRGLADGEEEDWAAREREKEKEKGQEEGGEEDMVMARRRREANERFFGRVKEMVDDVVGKLEGVASAMEKVEKESREIWNESDSVRSGSGSGSGSGAGSA